MNFSGPTQTTKGVSYEIKKSSSQPGPYGNDIENLSVQIQYETSDRVRILFQDPNNSNRFQVPIPLPVIQNAATNLDYKVCFCFK